MTNLQLAIQFMRELLDSPEHSPLKKHFLEDISYRCDQRNKSSRLAGLKEWRIISTRKAQPVERTDRSSILALTSSKHSIKEVEKYLQRNLHSNEVKMVLRDSLGYNFSSVSDKLRFIVFAIQISIQCFFRSKNRLNKALCIREVVEWASLLEMIESFNYTHFIDFSSFEKDSNALALLMQKRGVRVTKVPSPGPLSAHYKFVVCDELVLSSGYHLEELKSLSAQWKVHKYLCWPPELHHTYEHIYAQHPEPKLQTIGFYSHGEWLRRMESHADPGLDILVNEEALLADLGKFLAKHPHYELTIFPHPKERKSQHTQAYYQEKLHGIKYVFSEEGKPSAHLFHTVDVGLMAYSTLIFERLGMGYKTFIAKYTPSVFPVKESSLKALLFSDEESLEQQILKTENENRSKYFERNNISNHLISNFTRQL